MTHATPRPKLDKQQAQHVVISVGKGVTVTGTLYDAGRYVAERNRAVNTHERAKAALNYALSVLESIKTPVLDDLEIDVLDEPVDFDRIKAVLADMEG